MLWHGTHGEYLLEYEAVISNLRKTNRDRYIQLLRAQGNIVKPYENATQLLETGLYVANANIKAGWFEAYCDILKIDQDKNIPIIVSGTNKINDEQKFELHFASFVIGNLLKNSPQQGIIIDGNGKNHKINLSNGTKIISPAITVLTEWANSRPAEPPAIALGKKCAYCQYFLSCKDVAEKNDDLSQLDRLTPKLIKRYHEKGIFTLKQLSFQFKPRRTRKRKPRENELYKPELQALAIRTGNILIHDIPKLSESSHRIFLDIEGLPDLGLHYLIGLLICNPDGDSYQYFWADTQLDEEMIFRQFLGVVEKYDSPIYHYGSYEQKALRQLEKRYQIETENIQKRLINLNKHIFGKIYFPVKSNKLKEIGSFIGASWTAKNASGLQSVIWRYQWDQTNDTKFKDLLIEYNQEDCQAAKLLTDKIQEIAEKAELQPNIDFIDNPKKRTDDVGCEIHDQFQAILKFAHTDGFDKKKIEFENNHNHEKKKHGGQKGHPGHTKPIPPTDDVQWREPLKICPKCNTELITSDDKVSERTFIDLCATEVGYSKKITKITQKKGYCKKCDRYRSHDYLGGGAVFAHGFQSWVIYERMSLRLPYAIIVEALKEQFGEKISQGQITKIIRRFAQLYAETTTHLLEHILASPFIHADETKINIQGEEYYAWVFTDGRHVVLKMTETREASFVIDLLKDYKGILISDFYSAYDAVACLHQKCLVHLIRDMNDDLWKLPFDCEYQEFIREFKNLLVPIIETVHQYGLSKEYLCSFSIEIDIFYEKHILGKSYQSDVALKYQKRLKKYKDSLFRFIHYDGIPWNNNMAERALRHLVVQENIFKTFFKSMFPDHLSLLGIMQTCRFQQKSFLKFLISGEKDVDLYNE